MVHRLVHQAHHHAMEGGSTVEAPWKQNWRLNTKSTSYAICSTLVGSTFGLNLVISIFDPASDRKSNGHQNVWACTDTVFSSTNSTFIEIRDSSLNKYPRHNNLDKVIFAYLFLEKRIKNQKLTPSVNCPKKTAAQHFVNGHVTRD